jgi:hypothetical protein
VCSVGNPSEWLIFLRVIRVFRVENAVGLASKKWTPNQAALMFNFSYLSSKATGEI